VDKTEWLKRWHDRTLRYAHRTLDPARTITITAESARLRRFDTQVALLTGANLLGRISPRVKLAFADVPLHPSLPWGGASMHDRLLSQMKAANPFGSYTAVQESPGDFVIHIGREGGGLTVDGSGWNAYLGPYPSPLRDSADGNGFGTALAVILAAAQMFRSPFKAIAKPFVCNAFDWTDAPSTQVHGRFENTDLGEILFVGLGSVGSAALYYLGMTTRHFSPTLIDKDRVKIHNLSRSPLFVAADCVDEMVHPEGGLYKVDASKRFLHEIGVTRVESEPVALHRSSLWQYRPSGTPDVVVSAANEEDVRYHIEMGYPPIQIYATTGKNWQIALLRHLPDDEACSMCIFPPEESRIPMPCATDHVTCLDPTEQIDSALPFLSFGAGLMTAAEIVKLTLRGYPFCRSRVTLNLRSDPKIVATPLVHRGGCACEHRERSVQREMIRGSRYESI